MSRAGEEANLELEVVSPSCRAGWAVAASGMLDLADLLAQERLTPTAASLVGVAWAPTGHYSTLTLDQLQPWEQGS